jgi:hypothetical protein
MRAAPRRTAGQDVRLTRIERDEPAKSSDRKRAKRERRRKRELDRSRRAANRAQYQLSKRLLASFTVLVERGDPRSAQVDYAASADALGAITRAVQLSYEGWQDTLSESTDLSACDGSFVAWSTSTPDHVAVARRNVGKATCSTLNETGARRTTSDRARRQANMSRRYGPRWTYLRDKS